MAGGHAWTGGMRGGGGMHGRGHAWQGACMAGGVCGREGGRAWQGACVADTTRYGQ